MVFPCLEFQFTDGKLDQRGFGNDRRYEKTGPCVRRMKSNQDRIVGFEAGMER